MKTDHLKEELSMVMRTLADDLPTEYHELFPMLREVALDFDSPKNQVLDEEELGKLAEVRCRELGRRLIQAHLDRRHALEKRKAMKGKDGISRKHQRTKTRELLSVLGKVTVSRIQLNQRGVSGGLRPLDVELNLPPKLYSFGVLRHVAWLCAHLSFDKVVETLQQTKGLSLGKRQVEEAAVRCAQDFVDYYQCTAQEPLENADLLVLSFDGKGVIMHADSLRSATKKAANSAKSKLQHRLSPGEKTGRKRMAEVAAVYELPRIVRNPSDILSTSEGPPRKKGPRAINKRVWASLERSAKEVIDEAFLGPIPETPITKKVGLSWLTATKIKSATQNQPPRLIPLKSP